MASFSQLSESKQLILLLAFYLMIIVLAVICGIPSLRDGVSLDNDSKGWKFIGSSRGVDTYLKRMENMNGLVAMKGVVVIDAHISKVLAMFGDVQGTTEWVDMLSGIENSFSNCKSTSGNPLVHQQRSDVVKDLVYQYYNLPWPLQPREFLFKREFHFNSAKKKVTADYVSVEDDWKPLPTGTSNSKNVKGPKVIRGESAFTNWLFQDLEAYCKEEKAQLIASKQQDAMQNDSGTGMKQSSSSSRNPPQAEQQTRQQRAIAAPCFTVQWDDQGNSLSNKKVIQKMTKKTVVAIETIVDNKGSLPVWFVNHVQRSWPMKTLSAFRAIVGKGFQKQKQLPPPIGRVLKW
eukprot:CAMPEP_0175007230 /NCGR_PEP_ID=MMETSP0005-20121125/6290_1 /TAXON_ID=420556 /ORGANISM="Ochromonas sp., Strain CCMP1393" /LENGTH=346 /DNA_ID=CAMNT_0016262637 /DNA_START=18 /DNA_END=1058 /DNA_ORIENTATION=+